MSRPEFKFHEAVLKMSAGDVFSPHDPNHGEFYMAKNGNLTFEDGEAIILSSKHFNLLGFIIPAKKEMVSCDEWMEAQSSWLTVAEVNKIFINTVWGTSAENRDILYADLMEMISELMSMFKNMFATADTEIRVKNIKAELDKIDIAINPDHRPAGSTEHY